MTPTTRIIYPAHNIKLRPEYRDPQGDDRLPTMRIVRPARAMQARTEFQDP